MTARIKDVFEFITSPNKPTEIIKIGVAWVNRDGSLSVEFDRAPSTGRINIRDRAEIYVRREAQNGN